ncbi:MAG: sodium:proton antiporter [bacterium]|nr:sodium:proton antiporter [bacterium]
MTRKEENPIVSLVGRLVAPFIMIFALYVIFHGHYSPGGGFQGGTMLAAAVLLLRLAAGGDIAKLQFKETWGTPMGSVGVLIYFGTGLTAMLFGGNFLDYHYLPMGLSPEIHRYWGTLFVEIGVGIAVMGILVAIYDDLLEGEPN